MKELIKKLKEQGHFDEDLGLSKSEIDELKEEKDERIEQALEEVLREKKWYMD